MKQLFERTSSCWVRYDKYVIRKNAKGVKYITAAPDARPQIIEPLEDVQTMVLEALNVGRLFFGKKAPEKEQEAAILRFVHRYGLFVFITALPTTPKFMLYEKVSSISTIPFSRYCASRCPMAARMRSRRCHAES